MTSVNKGKSQITEDQSKHRGGRIREVFSRRRQLGITLHKSQDRNQARVVSHRTSSEQELMVDRSLNIVQIELERTQTSIINEVNKLAADIQESALTGNVIESKAKLDVLLKLGEIKRGLTDVLGRLSTDGSSLVTPIYTISSWFLNDCFRYLVQGQVEALHFVTGVQFGSVLTLDRMVTFEMSCQTPISASGEINSTHGALLEMENHGHKLHGCFHSHPGNGQGATFPSSIDFDYQSRLEKGGYASIGGIFSRDGYFRAYSLEQPFELIVYGKGVKKIDEQLFKLSEIN